MSGIEKVLNTKGMGCVEIILIIGLLAGIAFMLWNR